LPPFTSRALNRATLARQLLLGRSRISVPKAVDRLCAMQAQAPNAPYIGLWSRLENFDQARLTRALERRQVTRSTLFRVTVHLVSATNQPAFARLTHDQWREDFLREGVPLDELSERVERLAENGTFTYGELEAAMPELGERRFRVRCLTPLVHVPPSGTWRSPRIKLTTARRWLGTEVPDAAEAGKIFVRSYLAAFGPATRADVLRFSGLRVGTIDPALEALGADLRLFEDEQGRELLDLPRAPRPAPDTPAPVRFLPKWDALLLSHADRTRVLPDEFRSTVIKGGDVLETFLVDGLVAGSWRLTNGKIELEPFAPLPRSVRQELDDEARRLAAFVA
jgi:winged helix DNA-binding protein